MTLIGRSLLSCPPVWDHRWCANLWPVLPALPAHRPGASSALALSCSVRAAASGPPCHLGSSWHPESVPIWQPGTDIAGGAVTVTCLLSAVSFCTNKHAEKSYTRTQRHMVACADVSENLLPDFLLTTRGIVGMNMDKRFWFLHMKSPRFFCLCALVCRATSRFLLISISYFPGCADGFDSGPDHMIALASNACIHKEIGRGLRYSIWPSHWWNSVYLSLENVITRNRTPLKIL